MPAAAPAPLRLFLDAGVLVDGFFNRGGWGSCRGVLILATSRRFRPVLAQPISEEFDRALRSKTAHLPDSDNERIQAAISKWIDIARPEYLPWPSAADMLAHAGLSSAVRHRNDMPSVVAAVLARPDWVLSTNTRHWNQELAARTGLQISTPLDFLSRLRP